MKECISASERISDARGDDHMRFDNDYVNRYRSIPAASSIDEAPYDLLISRDIHPDDSNLYVTLPMHYHPEIEIIYVEYGEWYYRTAVNEFYTRAGENELVVFSAYEPHEAAMRSGIGYKTKCIC